jgi:hypothetical protein
VPTDGISGDETASEPVAPERPPALLRVGRLRIARPARVPVRWLSIFGLSLTAFLIRLLVPVPIGQADNRDGPRVMCGFPLHMGPVYNHDLPRYFRFAYFPYATTGRCAGHLPYPTSEMAPLVISRLLTPMFGLPGQLNLIALGILMSALASVGIASLVTGLRIRLWAQVLLAASIWVIVADSAFFDVFASPFEEPAMIVGLLLLAAGLVYLGRGRREGVAGLVLAGAGGLLAIMSKEQYLILAVPVCPAIILASMSANSRGQRWRQRLRTRPVAEATAVALALAFLAGSYAAWDTTSNYGQRLHHIQSVDTIFQNIVTGDDNVHADLRALGLPQSWATYAGTFYWDRKSVRNSPLFTKYEPELTDANVAHFLLTHPGRIWGVAQQSAIEAQVFRVTELGTYAPSAGHKKGAFESRVVVVTRLMHQLPRKLGLYLLLPVWLVMAGIALLALLRRRRPWHRNAAVVVLCLLGWAVAAFIPPGFFEGISTTRHMVGMNLATWVCIPLSVALAASMLAQLIARGRPQASRRRSSQQATAGMATPYPSSRA